MPDAFPQIAVVEARRRAARRAHLQAAAAAHGPSPWLLDCDRKVGGPWAGVSGWVEHLLPHMQTHAPDLLVKHDYELISVLPGLQKTLAVRNPSLTDVATDVERVRNYPADRAYRIAHGLIELLCACRALLGAGPLVVACDSLDRAGPLARYFFAELLLRQGQALQLTLLCAVEPGGATGLLAQIGPQVNHTVYQADLPADAAVPDAGAPEAIRRLHQHAETHPEEVEQLLPQLVGTALAAGDRRLALYWQSQACGIYGTRGFYEDALFYGEAAMALLEQHDPAKTRPSATSR